MKLRNTPNGVSLAATWLAVAAAAAFSQDVPTTGLVYNTKERSSLTYECELTGDLLSCTFTQVGVRQKLTDEDLKTQLAEAAKQELRPADPKLCGNVERYIGAAEGRGTLPDGWLLPLTESEKADSLRSMKALRTYCKSPTRENANAMARVGNDVDFRTCLVRSYHFKQTFALVSDSGSKKKSWVVRASPVGACGTVQLDRFEPKTLSYAPELKQWKYVARKAVTNPEGEAFPGMKCSALDEDVYTYTSDITQNKRPAKCDYIEFSVL